jgi:hypothetical protein
MTIDDDANASAIISGESLQFSSEFAKLMAGKGAKVQVAKALKTFGISFAFNCHELTPTAFNILYGGEVITSSIANTFRIRNKMTSPGVHKFKFVILTNADKDITITFFRASNESYGNIAFDGSDFAGIPAVISPSPLNPSDPDEIQVDIDFEI